MFKSKTNKSETMEVASGAPAAAQPGVHSQVLTNGAWFKRGFYLSLCINVSLAFALASFGVVTVLAQVFTDQQVRFAALTKDRRVIEIQTYDQPVSSDQSVIAWYTGAVMDSLDLDAAHYKRDLDRARYYYDEKAFSQFVVGLKSAGYLDYIVDNKLMLRAAPLKPGRLIEHGVDSDGVYFWKIEIPTKLAFETGRKNVPTQDVVVTATVKRADFVRYDSGLKITQIFLTDYR